MVYTRQPFWVTTCLLTSILTVPKEIMIEDSESEIKGGRHCIGSPPSRPYRRARACVSWPDARGLSKWGAVYLPSPRERRRRRTKTAKRRSLATKVRAVRIVVGLRAEVCPHGATALR